MTSIKAIDIKVARQRGVKKIGVGMKGRIEVYHIMVVAQHLSLGIDRVLAGIDRVLAEAEVVHRQIERKKGSKTMTKINFHLEEIDHVNRMFEYHHRIQD
ncbi:hypothetical protein RF55_15064 [Lasius niger]|uniref:Uncharacterized protein n=1 Tax=Lasius niger TaxID=67767 RepID=A0A0J7K7C0_LASNI|nr:hypothetical protein RF55_15064 [Lasius niger]